MNKNRISAILTVALLLSTALSSVQAQDYRQIYRLGTSETVCKNGVNTAGELQAYFANNRNTLTQILNDSGWAGNAEDLFAAVANGQFSETTYPVGTKLAWMGANVKGNFVAKPYIEWAGKESMAVYRIDVASDGVMYEMIVPKICCNLSLVSASPIAQVAQPTAVASAKNTEVQEPTKSLFPFIGLFAGSETRARYAPHCLSDVSDSSSLVGIRAGLMKKLSAATSAFAQLSYYDRTGLDDNLVYPEDNLALDLGLEKRLSDKAFIGGGIGLWNIDDSDFRDASLFGHVGADIGDTAFQWFLEGRVFDSDSDTHDSISDNNMVSAGVRYIIK